MTFFQHPSDYQVDEGKTLSIHGNLLSKTSTPHFPHRVCLEGYAPGLGFIRSVAYFSPEFLLSDWEKWRENKVIKIKLVYNHSGLSVFDGTLDIEDEAESSSTGEE